MAPITAARTVSTRMLSIPKLLDVRYRGGFRPNPGSGSFGSWYAISTVLLLGICYSIATQGEVGEFRTKALLVDISDLALLSHSLRFLRFEQLM
jgi:hypothetical protein